MKPLRHTCENKNNKDKKRKSHNPNEHENEDNRDTVSDFPDCVLLHILSFLNARDVVRTCVLSSRWKYLWKYLPTLTLSSNDFKTLEGFTKFVYQILSLRDSSTALKALSFEHGDYFCMNPHLLKRIITYAASHNVNCLSLPCYIEYIPLFSCRSLTSLELGYPNNLIMFPNSLDLPALTYLKLHFFSFFRGDDGRVKPFFTFDRLNTLILYDCVVLNSQPLCISNTTLLNLSISMGIFDRGNLKIELSAPNLSIFAFTGTFSPNLCKCHFSSIKQASFDIHDINDLVATPLHLFNLLIEMTDIKSLTVTPRTLQALSLVLDIMKLKFPSLHNLESLKLNINLKWDIYIYSVKRWIDMKLEQARDKSWKENAKLREAIKAALEPKYSSILDGMIEFLLQNSPSAKVDVISV